MKSQQVYNRGWNWARQQDLKVLTSIFVVIVSLWGIIELADEVKEGKTRTIDNAILKAFRNPEDFSDPLGPIRVEEAVRDITALGSTTVVSIFVLAVIGFLLILRKIHAAAFLVIAIAGAMILNSSLKYFFQRPRPDIVPHLHRVTNESFPSGHTLHATVVYLVLGAFLARLVSDLKLKIYILSFAFFVAFLVGVSRIYLGVHYPTDVLAGWSVGLMWAILCWLFVRFLQRKGTVEPPK